MVSCMWMFVAVLYMLLDVAYFVRGLLVVLLCKIMLSLGFWKKGPLEECVYYGICLSTDMDFQWHMNNSRYLRECDFGRIEMWILNGVYDTANRLNGGITMGASTIRYRKSIQLFDTYMIKSRILCWDEKNFYVEQKFVRRHDNFICAIVLVRQAIIKSTPTQILKELTGKEMTSPEFPEDVQAWVNFNTLSSEKLKKNA